MKLSFTDGFSWYVVPLFFLLNEHNLSSEAQMVHPKVKAVVFVGTLREFPEETTSEID